MNQPERKAAFILATIAVAEGTWVWLSARRHPLGFLRYEGFIDGHAGIGGWLAALVVFAAFTGYAVVRLRSVRQTWLSPSALKLLALAVAVTAGFCEETIFRKWVMDGLESVRSGVGVQVLASALAFGIMHGIWGLFRGSLTAAIGATLATGVLGDALAIVFVVSHRVLAPCIVSHFLINAFAEPGLVLAAVRGEMARR
jgi:membrane protease YdiL (CAAX protease family)